MVKVYGTSHVSQQSIELIDRKIETEEPDIIALELDYVRLNALINKESDKTSKRDLSLFLKLIKRFQDLIGSQTGVMPGEEMKHAYEMASKKDLEVALIDQDIRVTINRLKNVSRKEKIKAMLSLGLAYIIPTKGGFDVSQIPDQETINELLKEMQKRYPGLYQVLVEERNQIMTEYLVRIQEENPDKKIIAFVGAAHEKEIREKVKQRQEADDVTNNNQSKMEE